MNGLILDISDCFQLVFLILAVVYSAHSGNRITLENVISKRKKINSCSVSLVWSAGLSHSN
jgi:hypothetical protein